MYGSLRVTICRGISGGKGDDSLFTLHLSPLMSGGQNVTAEDCLAFRYEGIALTHTRMDLSRLYLTNGIIKREIYSVSWLSNFISKCSDPILWLLNLKC